MIVMKPSDIRKVSAMGSIMNRFEAEVVATNIVKILARTGNTWRDLGWDEYKTERLADGNFSESERGFFEQVIDYCTTSHGAAAFCSGWAEVAIRLEQTAHAAAGATDE